MADCRPNIILSPHFDDAVFSLGGFIATSPARMIVATIFATAPPNGAAGRWDRRSGFKTAVEAIQARSEENAAALAILGLPTAAIENFGHLDRQYRPDDRSEPLISAIAEDIRRLVRRHGDRVNLFSPAFPHHADHRIVTEAVLTLRRAGHCADAEISLYQDQPYAYLDLRKRSLMPLKFARYDWPPADSAGLAGERRLLELDDAAAAKKLLAARQYKSQFPVVQRLLYKMIDDFSRYQARAAGSSSPRVELVYRLAPAAAQS
jgi:LmbE family N-acetylglucosaminyl deacetylase